MTEIRILIIAATVGIPYAARAQEVDRAALSAAMCEAKATARSMEHELRDLRRRMANAPDLVDLDDYRASNRIRVELQEANAQYTDAKWRLEAAGLKPMSCAAAKRAKKKAAITLTDAQAACVKKELSHYIIGLPPSDSGMAAIIEQCRMENP